MKLSFFLALITVCLSTQMVQASPVSAGDSPQAIAAAPARISFIENRGQWEDVVRFKAEVPGGAMFLTDGGFAYAYTDHTALEYIHEKSRHDPAFDENSVTVRHHAYYVHFVDADTTISYKQDQQRTTYHNYFLGNDRSKWAGGVPIYGKVIQQGVYAGIDAVTYSQGNSIKYEFVVEAGADPSRIALQFEGVEPELTPEGDLRITTSVNEVIEKAPYSYQQINGEEVEVISHYKLDGTRLSFEFPNGYNPEYPLVIDPTLIFATYCGGTSGPYYAHSTTFGRNGTTYAAGLGVSTGWPTTPGAFQSTGLGFSSQNVCINKYDSAGANLIYSTYYSGNGYTVPNVMRENPQGELVLAGATSSRNLPVTVGAYDSVFNSGADLYVAHFNVDGTDLIGATYIGGGNMEPGLLDIQNGNGGTALSNAGATSNPVEIAFDSDGNIWISSNSASPDFPVTSNALQSTHAGLYDGVLFQLDPTCSNLLYSTFLGGSANDGIFMLEFIDQEKIVLVGGTKSTDFPTTAGVLHPTAPGGGDDGFVTIIDISTNTIVASTYLGTDQQDNATKVQVSDDGEIYVLGRTLGNYPITPGVWSMPNTDVYVDVLTADLTASVVSTRLGKTQGSTMSGAYLPSAFLLDICGNVYVAGLTSGSTTGLPLTDDAFQSNASPFWFCVLKPNFSDILFGSYFGTSSDHHHAGASHFSPEGVVYHSTCSTNGSYPTTAGAYSEDKLGSSNDVISFKFDFEATGVRSVIDLNVSQNDSVCAPGVVEFKNASTSPYSITYHWDFGDGHTSTEVNPVHTYDSAGLYEVVLHAHSDSACVTDAWDTFYITVLYTELPDIVTEGALICSDEDAIELNVFINNPAENNLIHWGPSNGILSGADSSTVTVDPSVNTLYYVTVKDTIPGVCGFSVTDTVRVDFKPRALNILTNDTVVCEGALVEVVAQSVPGYSFHWAPSTGVSDTTALDPVISVHQSETYTLTASYPGCPDTAQTLSIEMQAYPVVDLGGDKEICQWQEVSLESHVTPYRNDYSYSWTPAEGLSTPDGPNVEYMADTSGRYVLLVSTPIGCMGSDTIDVLVHPGGFGDIAADTGFCPSGSVPLWASGGTSYLWEPAYGLDDSSAEAPIASPNVTTDYTVYITNAHNCVDTERVVVEVFPASVINLPDSITVFPGEAYHLQPGTNAHYFNWFPTNGISSTTAADPSFNPAVRTRYFVTATTEQGCSVVDSMDVLVSGTVIDMPNAFVPGRSSNPVFKASKRGIAELQEFAVFNRWGVKVFSTTDIDAGWDGTYNGTPQPMGVYIYQIRAVLDSGQVYNQEGDVTLIR